MSSLSNGGYGVEDVRERSRRNQEKNADLMERLARSRDNIRQMINEQEGQSGLQDRVESYLQPVRRMSGQDASLDLKPEPNEQRTALVDAPKEKERAKPRVILIMTVEIGDGKRDTIKVHAGDHPRVLAENFCHKHSLSADLLEPLTEHIRSNVAALPSAEDATSLAHNRRYESEADNAARPSTTRSTYDDKSKAKPTASARPSTGGAARPKSAGTKDRTPGRLTPSASQSSMLHSAAVEDANRRSKTPTTGPMNAGRDQQQSSRSKSLEKEREEYFNKLKMEMNHAFQHNRRMQHSPKIDDRSRRIASDRNRSPDGRTQSVFQRLHQQASMRKKQLEDWKATAENREKEDINKSKGQMTYVSREMMKQRTVGPYENYGQRLYEEGIKSLELKQAQAEREKEKREKEVERELTFRPEISEMAKRLVRDGPNPFQQILEHMDKRRNLKQEKLRKEKEEREEAECTFQPIVNRRSEKLVQQRVTHIRPDGSASGSTHEHLFQDAERRKMKVEEYEQWLPEEHTFHPDIGSNKFRPKLDSDSTSFVDRLVHSKKDSEEEIEHLRQKIHAEVDPATGKPLYKPTIGRAPSFNRNTADLPIGDFLFASRFEFTEVREKLRQQEDERLTQLAKRPFARGNSLKILEEKKKERFHDLFNHLDKEKLGYLTAVNCSVSDLEPELITALGPISAKLAADPQLQMDYNQFQTLFDEELRNYKAGPLNQILISRRHKEGEDSIGREYSFKPDVNRHSEELVKHKRADRNTPIYEALMKEKDVWEEKRKKEAAHKQQEELSQCTFAPKILERSSSGLGSRGRSKPLLPTQLSAPPRSASNEHATPTATPTIESTAAASAQ
eukprot:GILJ01010311.1.p1 GENE.GILJ01010311.1~~GILJ01010311.1.p1  ORF type:complete len:848 (-),score=134.53 GILJ01010311.1:87-2630(-)